MNTHYSLALAAILAAGLSGRALAEGAYDRLPAGEKRIADALYASQSGPVVMSRDQIATSRQGTGWGQVFHRMQTDGWTDAKSLGEVVSASRHSGVTTGTRAGVSASRSTTVITARGNHSGSFGAGRGRGH